MINYKILLVDDHPFVREWFMGLIQQEPGYEICGEAGNIPDALQMLRSCAPDIAIVDIWLEGGSGLELIKDIKALRPEVAVIVLSMHDEAIYAERAMRAGARAYVTKRDATSKILDAIKAVIAGKTYFSPAINALMAQKLARGSAGSTDSPLADLSDRELEVFEMLGQGINTRQIAEHLKISPKTVQVYCSRIKDKLSLANVNELITHAARWQEGQQGQ